MTSAMRILVGMPDKKSRGGPIYCEPPFVNGLRAAGVEVDEEISVYGDGVQQISWLRRIYRVLEAAWRLRRRARVGRYDVIHLNTSFDEKCVLRDAITMAFVQSSGAGIYLKMHGSSARFLTNDRWFWRYWKRRVFTQADAVGVLSEEERDNFLRAGCPAEKLQPAKYVVESEEFQPDPNFRARHGLAQEVPVLLFSARLIPAKGLLEVIRACAQLRSAGREFALFCLGDGPERNEAQQTVRDLRLNENVRFFGHLPEAETAAFHANCTIFVFPSYHDEGFPLVLLKSLAAGSPIVTTRIRGAADYLQDPDNCLWVEPSNPSQLAAKIGQLLDDLQLRKTMAANNRRLARHFTATRIAREYIELYQTITVGKAARRFDVKSATVK